MDDEQHPAGLDYRRLFAAAPDLYLVVDCELTITAATDAYLYSTSREREAIIGRSVSEVFANGDVSDGYDPCILLSSFERVRSSLLAESLPMWRGRLRSPPPAPVEPEDRWWSATNTPVLDSHGQLLAIVHRLEDVTEVVALRDRHRETNDLRQELLSAASIRAEQARQVERAARLLIRANEEVMRLHERATQLSRLHDEMDAEVKQLRHALDSRVVIEQAKGIIAAEQGVSMDEAFARLRRRARDQNMKLHELAEAVVKLGVRP